MRGGQMVLVKCRIRKGAFSGERVFQLQMAESSEEYIGIASVDHCLDSNRSVLEQNAPRDNETIDGFIEAYLIENGGNEARVELPDGEAILVENDQIPFRRAYPTGSEYVSV